jgi:hypothetical protein
MVGAYITFLVVLVIVATYMTIVHAFLRSAELPEDRAREEREREAVKPVKAVSGRTQFAH